MKYQLSNYEKSLNINLVITLKIYLNNSSAQCAPEENLRYSGENTSLAYAVNLALTVNDKFHWTLSPGIFS